MALNGTTLGTEIKDALVTALGILGIDIEDEDEVEDIWQAIAETIVTHITTNAVVPSGITVSVDPQTHAGSTTGTGTVT